MQGQQNGNSPDTPPGVLDPSPFLLRSAFAAASTPSSVSGRSFASTITDQGYIHSGSALSATAASYVEHAAPLTQLSLDLNTNKRSSATVPSVECATPAASPPAKLSFTALVNAPAVTPAPAAGHFPVYPARSMSRMSPVKADAQAETADGLKPEQASHSAVKSGGSYRSGFLAVVSSLPTAVRNKLTPAAKSSSSSKQGSGSSTSGSTSQRIRAHTPEPANATPATVSHGSITAESSAGHPTATGCTTSSDISSHSAALGVTDAAAPYKSPAAKAASKVGRMLRKKPVAANSASGTGSGVQSSSLSKPVQQKADQSTATSCHRLPPKAQAGAMQISATAASSAAVAAPIRSGPGSKPEGQTKARSKDTAGSSAKAAEQDKASTKGTVGSRLFGLRQTASRIARAGKAVTIVGKAEQAASASQSKSGPAGCIHAGSCGSHTSQCPSVSWHNQRQSPSQGSLESTEGKVGLAAAKV